ncbi:hypothetical protein [Paracoccus onubensis]|uniref:Uncharacterized protein n=1 Tax=Paracoccus onubensis TaxID=1675788 RepID=A0A418SN52_9RHOB|nr:hypothetical protein [Paracoccus onubensis]RJE82391.1 hypothetical protein D3P04_19855 [Paracoccus onubensis]
MMQAINMNLAERRHRHSALLEGIMEHDVNWWSSAYLSVLGK